MYAAPSGTAYYAASDAPGPSYTRRLGGFEVEHTPNRGPSRLPGSPEPPPDEEDETDLPTAVARLLAAKARPCAIGGKIALDPTDLVLFFRAPSGVAHALEFPVDADGGAPPALDVLLSACEPVSLYSSTAGGGPPALMYPPRLPWSATLELAAAPVLATVRSALLAHLPAGTHLAAVRERLDVLVPMGRAPPASPTGDGRLATLLVTLPVRFRGGALVVRGPDGRAARFAHSKRAGSAVEWAAWTEGSIAEIEPVRKGFRLDVRYAIHARDADGLVAPPEEFRTLLGGVLNLTRSRHIGFYLSGEYGHNPAEAPADALVPLLTGGDLILYQALRAFDLTPVLHWTAGGYIWPVDRAVDIGPEVQTLPRRRAFGPGMPAPGGPAEEVDRMRARVEASGAAPLAGADIMVLADWDDALAAVGASVGKERVPFVDGGVLGRLVVHALLVVYVA